MKKRSEGAEKRKEKENKKSKRNLRRRGPGEDWYGDISGCQTLQPGPHAFIQHWAGPGGYKDELMPQFCPHGRGQIHIQRSHSVKYLIMIKCDKY